LWQIPEAMSANTKKQCKSVTTNVVIVCLVNNYYASICELCRLLCANILSIC
jgi:hypothetical protein